MGHKSNKKFRDINEENKNTEDKNFSPSYIILMLSIGMVFYFAYYVLITDYFKLEAFKFPYIIISIYFAIATLLFPYASRRVNIWIEGNKVINFLSTSKLAMPFAYVFAPIVFIIDLL